MSYRCEICRKEPSFGKQVTFSHKRSSRRWNPNIQKINQKKILNFQFPTSASLAEQRRTIAFLSDLEQKVNRLKDFQAEGSAKLDALLPSILDKAFRGEL